MKPKIIILPGNGDNHIETDNWYAWVRDELKKQGYTVTAEDMPDPLIARMDIWLPHIENVFKADENTIIIGHSSGAVAALRYLETHKLFGAIIVGANYTDLGDSLELESGYYTAPWQWQKIKQNAQRIVQFCSQDDPYIPVAEPRYIHAHLDTEYHEFTTRGHFQDRTFPELIDIIGNKSIVQ
jgi:hypothetical protein